ncbi:glycosyltransferase [Flavobacterium sp. SH_e]|uniref:Glycosyltransferase involved in cell wall bisynthesis n=1 Tax=Flavobacterium anhuiense TaxID=459526 RepID=A0AAC9GI90_9FLAO|nr:MULTISPECIES: glycosyltransferase family 2 protein [Flavobacterium]AOC95310.1 PGL/p-HBAD biosynthesis glycosyltransferase [Flavobacterium anhuiense]MCV2484005.1 glycosyltransferase [Flavobacterium sp. SH_e]SCY85199.1 Glycosyltransferase involved in cell wall bisynthesis [Flavobacterium anhuiense]
MALISIITINYNNLEGLKKTVESVINQTWQDFEYIIIDGGSTDGSVEYIENKKNKIDYWISENDSGIYNAMNKGIKIASGKYISFMNSGDCFLSLNTLKLCSDIIINNNADVFYGQIKIDDVLKEKTVIYPSKLRLSYLQYMVINHQACFFLSETLQNFHGYNEEYKLAADYHYYLKLYINGKTFLPILFPIVKYDLTGISSLRMEEYKIEMKKVWDSTIPHYLFETENNYFSLLTTIKDSKILRLAFKLRDYKIKLFNGR